MSKITFIVSAFDRPLALRCCLASLQIQTERDIQVIVADNSVEDHACTHMQIVREMHDERIGYWHAKQRTCYESTKLAGDASLSEWLCFPNDDSYYMPEFAERMLRCAAANPDSGLIYCDEIYDPRMTGEYVHHNVMPICGSIDKACFIIKQVVFKDVDFLPAPDDLCRDGLLVDELVRRAVPMTKAPGIMVCHN